MNSLPETPNLDHLKRQAKDLFAAYRRHQPEAMDQFRRHLPVVRGASDADLMAAGLRLADAQSCIARAYGYASWADLRAMVELLRLRASDVPALRLLFAQRAYGGDLSGHMDGAQPRAAAQVLEHHPEITQGCVVTAAGAGAVEPVRAALQRDTDWINQPGGPLMLTPVMAACHSGLLGQQEHRAAVLEVIRLLLEAGADASASVASRWPPASLHAPDETTPLSPLYGAAGVIRDPEAVQMLLAAGADPNDGESLYHAVENVDCLRLLLEAGARVTGTNALYRVLDFHAPIALALLLKAARGAPELQGAGLLAWAIRRRRAPEIFAVLLEGGCDPAARMAQGQSLWELALRYGLREVAEMLRAPGSPTAMSGQDRFLAACAAGEAAVARDLLSREPGLIAALKEAELTLLPELAASGASKAVRLMVELGWPIEVKGGDWGASALNQAVFRGDAQMARFLLERGASWQAQHGFGDDVSGTLCWASQNRPIPEGDWVACAEALLEHGMPGVRRDPNHPGVVLMAGRPRQFSDAVTECLLDGPVG
ncbi:ankyrin repeat domain-containing protein [Tritonibacter mobilis]|uniref:ankyrin repeat domain-containing protein n=1 Tax=Tritonibacter mobilis TaxID=379347 RepID=UPI0008068B6C|nr:ankyrin repeat domain-containing protein [Tritonibacter mobilis]